MPKIRAKKPMFHGGSFRPAGSVFDVSDAVIAKAKERFGKTKVLPPFELVPQAKAPPQADDLV